ncbi:hypothetical protein [Winogradskyella schleiferi]|uniref:hypothetical protein n=1 Tax=Winogradskyella schleiferi TaxID=2686078 RepID=UPI0015BD637F|nr:hypothetical protein [Winogradskyella schleiferi]
MKKQLPTMLAVALMSNFALSGCSADLEPPEENCACERVTYIESKNLEETTDIWYLDYQETARESVVCQNETDYSVPLTGATEREVFRIECD